MQASAQKYLHVALNAHLLSGQASYRSAGVHQYVDQLLRNLDGVDDDVRITALVGSRAPEPPTEIDLVRASQDTSKPARRTIWEQFVQPRVLRRIEADLAHGPVFVGPLLAPCPVVTTIHDLSFIRFPHLFRPANRLYLKTMTRLSAHAARRVIAVSDHTARESVELLGVPRKRISVVYHGVDPAFQPLPAEQVTAFCASRGLPEQFVLFVGTLEPRKNLTRLIEAFARIRQQESRLVLVGGKGWLYDQVFARVDELGLGDVVLFPGYVPNGELPLWYNAATVFAYPSLYEGFGMPVTEAQACGTPVMASNTTSLPEAAGDAALLVDPLDVEAIAAGLDRLLGDHALREQLTEQGLAHARTLTWSRTARETIQVYRQASV